MKKIFYSWQSDIDETKKYVGHRLDNAVRQVDDWEVETATRNVPGAPDISATILSKIEKCDLFLADVSIINPGADGREMSNPNVMYELGYAMAIKGQDNLILIADKSTTNRDNLPFDIHNRRVLFADLNDANKATLSKDLASILRSHNSLLSKTDPSFSLLGDRGGWANWGMRSGTQSGFRYHLNIDNFGGKLEYVDSIRIEALDKSGDSWSASHFQFDELGAGMKLKIEPDEIKDAWVFITDQPGQTQRLIPDLDTDSVKLLIILRSNGQKIELPISPDALVNN